MSVINTNVMSLNAQRNLATNSADLGTTIQRLSSGLRINSAKDDAAGLAISQRFTTQVRGMDQAARNANDGISLAQTAEGALGEIGNNLQRIRELAVQSRNATNSADDRAALQKEVDQLKSEIGRVAETTNFNGTKLLDGSFTAQSFQVGANQGETIDIANIANASTEALGTWTAEHAVATQSTVSGAFGETAAATDAANTFSIELDTTSAVNITVTTGETLTGADIDAALQNNADTLRDAGYTFTGSAAAGDLRFSKTDGSDMTIAVTNEVGGTPEGGFANNDTFAAAHTNGEAAGSTITGFAGLDISTVEGADNAMLAMDAALKSVNDARADLGAIQNRFSSVVTNLQTGSENLSAARSRIMDADYAKETANLSRTQILQQAGTAMLAQANQSSQSVLSLLR
ncbi:flagellin [Novilysobacter defluvii]|uniref:Flagellin n=1 Tax=Lysobacter defluvii IMMIB APB-9 = DSM 18482 TaxID=1385515 RepID=A0A0A0MBE9_9GAMM|nr:flagellin [Lysobacter defluvii]KGO98731.1 flagellin [Lysobacter defluvii IMMIB APB-9 = DSM 18482]